MPKHNPKLDQPSKNKKKEGYKREVDSYEDFKNYTPLYMAIIFIGILIIVGILIVYVFNQEGMKVEQYDLVKLDYEFYTLKAYEGQRKPFISKTDTWLNVCSRYDSDCQGGLIKGFYNELLGRKVGDSTNYKLLEKCIDKNKDGYDDYTGKTALSYGFEDDTYFNTDIVFWFRVRAIEKKSSNNGEVTAAAFRNELEIILVIYKKVVVEVYDFPLSSSDQ